MPVNTNLISHVPVSVAFGCHCFTEEFKPQFHRDHHRYVHNGELRAFDIERFQCSLQLPEVVLGIVGGRVYRADRSYTYVAQIELAYDEGSRGYSIFFSLDRAGHPGAPAARMFVKSAYMKPLVAKTNAQSWRFAALVGQISGAYPISDRAKQRKLERR
ncbi:hypothetical protein [Roseateles chitinivorans]|uniref:hypothetical protein n=1 Tax=Roseateles chitinivorans TaxID=2917965 RepID=UPI003D66ABEF